MRRSFLAVFLGHAIALALPSAASALDYSPFQVRAPYDALPIDGTTTPVTPVGPIITNSSNAYAVVPLPFTFFFYGEAFNQVNMSADGYITFGTDPTGQGKADQPANQTIPNTAAPTGLVAAWWDDNVCPESPVPTMRTQTYGDPGQRWFVLEWFNCFKLNNTSTFLQMQIRLQEGSPIIRVYYGDTPQGGSGVGATVGIENPATYDDTGTMLTAGGTRGQYGLLDNAIPPKEICQTNCDYGHWPEHTMIQYGRPPLPDLRAGGLRVTSLVRNATSIDATIENTFANGGQTVATGVTWDLYLSADERFDPEDRPLGCRHDPAVDVPEASGSVDGAIAARSDCTFELPPPGTYRFCTAVDPDDTILEANELNNWYCSDSFAIGSDLIGDISIPMVGNLGSRVSVRVTLTNAGTDPTGTFAYTIYWKNCYATSSSRHAYTGTHALGGGESQELELDLFLDPAIDAEAICAELVIDEANAVPEQSEDNNVASTCIDLEKGCMDLGRANLEVRQIGASMPRGCFFGEPVGLEAEICNTGGTSATGFGMVFLIDETPDFSLFDTFVLAVPQSCSAIDPTTGQYYDDPSLCIDLGGGNPDCIQGICHPPCAGNGDCGNQGLECLDDPLLEIGGVKRNSCQLSIPAGECEWVRGTIDLPALDMSSSQHPDGIPFADGRYFIGSIVDYTAVIRESLEDDNIMYVDQPFSCRTPRPDFEAVSLRSISPVSAGEPFPVYRKVRNNGVVAGAFSYRYVLSSNDSASTNDIPVEILEIENHQIVGQRSIAVDEIEAFETLETYDTIRIPAGVVPGDNYRLGIFIDSQDAVVELDEENNGAIWCDPLPDGSCLPHLVRVLDPPLQITTQSLPTAAVGQSYHVQLLAKGGGAPQEWFFSGGELPPGLSVDKSGLISGTVVEMGDYLFEVTVTSGALSDTRMLAIRAVAASSPLTITTYWLPTAYTDVDYVAELGASGGAPPYAWSCQGLPLWAQLTKNTNTILGKPTIGASAATVTCAVKDASGRTLTAVYTLQVQAASAVRITSSSISFSIGKEYTATIGAYGGSGSYVWDFDQSTIPAGLRPGQVGDAGIIGGTPIVCGSFLVSVSVTDVITGAIDSAEISLEVACDVPRLATRNVPNAIRGQDYPETQLIAEGAVKFALVLGELPRGLALSEHGLLSGKVASDADIKDYNIAIELSDAAGGTGLGALTISVPATKRDLTRVEEVDKGCSTSGEGSTSGLLTFAALLALLGFRGARIQRIVGPLSVLATAVLPSVASAQSAQGYQFATRSIVYERLTDYNANLGITGTENIDNACTDAIPLPFTFPFFGVPYTTVWANTNGVLLFSGQSFAYTNAHIPSDAIPNNFIAPWFDDLEINRPGDIRTKVRGTAPNREFVIEWLIRDREADSQPAGEMQVSLFEGGDIAMRWGDPGADVARDGASVGIEDAHATAASIRYLSCTPTCTQTEWVTHLMNKEVVFFTAPNLVVLETSTTPEGHAGLEQAFMVKARNLGTKATRAAIELFVSEDQEISTDDYSLGKTQVVDFAGGQIREESIIASLPRTLDVGPYYVLARVDPDHVAEEFDETDNDGGAYRFVIRPPVPDFAVNGIDAPASGTPGARIVVGLHVANIGNLGAKDVPFQVVLSPNEVISAIDSVIYEGTLDIGWMTVAEVPVLVEIPIGTPAGIYYLGAWIDPDNTIPELDELNNTHAAERELVITATGLLVSTRLPAELQVGAPYCVLLEAEGGDGVYTWSLVEGTLPPGLEIEADSNGTLLCGTPTKVGVFDFTLGVTSGGMTQRTEQSLEVTVAPVKLAIGTQVLTGARFNVPYESGLTANGGRAPYRWEILFGELPAGLTLAEDGLIFGRPLVDGAFSFDVQVIDANGDKATATVRLFVAGSGRTTCSTRTLGSVDVGRELDLQLHAGGGTHPYSWKSVQTIRIGDAGGIPLADYTAPPPGIELRETGEVVGVPTQIGRYLWTVEVNDKANVPGNADTCTISVEILPGQGLSVATTTLPLVLVGEEYSVQLEARGGSGDYLWTLSDQGGLPNGLFLGEKGVIFGNLAESDLQNKESRTWSFLVEVRDKQDNNRGAGALSVTLTQRQVGSYKHRTKTTEGCSAGAGGVDILALGLVALGLRRR